MILHIDMDAFYASVEQADNPSLKGRPVIVGGIGERGVVSAASYEVREYGVHSAMPVYKARRLCPEAVFLPVRIERYKQVSRIVMKALHEFTPFVEQVSIDEAFLDITGTERLWGKPEKIGRLIKTEIKERTGLACSVGIAPLKFLAKFASDRDKPDGLVIIEPDEVMDVIKGLPVEKVPGVGRKTATLLHSKGIWLLGDIGGTPSDDLVRITGAFGKRLIQFSRGIDTSSVSSSSEVKSVSCEDTFDRDTDDMGFLKMRLMAQAEETAHRLRIKGVKGYSVILKVKKPDFTQLTRQVTLSDPTDSSQVIYENGCLLIDRLRPLGKIRLVGIGVSHLLRCRDLPEQMDLFSKGEREKRTWNEIDKAMDFIRGRFGKDAIKRAGVMKEKDP